METFLFKINLLRRSGKKRSLVSGKRPGENVFITYQPANVYQNIQKIIKRTNKKNKNKRKQKTLKKKREYLRKID